MNKLYFGDNRYYARSEGLNSKTVDRIGGQLRQLYADDVDDPFPKSLCRLIEELA